MSKEEQKVKNNIKINGSNFNKVGVAAMTKEAFVKMHVDNPEIFPEANDKEKQLSDAYDLITGGKGKPNLVKGGTQEK